ncbi:MAG: hypothetical protein ACYTKD_18070 [Planctomycetota bacterium]|jgi:hypothetical protein
MNVLSATLASAGLLCTYAAAASAPPVKRTLSDSELVMATKVTVEEGEARALTVQVRRTPMSFHLEDDFARRIMSFKMREQVKGLRGRGWITEDHWGGSLAFIVRSTTFNRPKGQDDPPSGQVSQVLGTAYADHGPFPGQEIWRADIARSGADGSIVLLVVGWNVSPRLHMRLFRLSAEGKQPAAEPQFDPADPMGWPRGAPLVSEQKLTIDHGKGVPNRVSLAYSDRRTVVCVFNVQSGGAFVLRVPS